MSSHHTSWTSKTFSGPGQLTRQDLVAMFHGEYAGIKVKHLLPSKDCQNLTSNIKRATATRSRKYKGNLNIGTVLDMPSHWELEYIHGDESDWQNYFERVNTTNSLRKKLFSKTGDPISKIMGILRQVWGAPVRIATHPIYGQKLYAGIIRSGAPRRHFDWARFDLPRMEIVGQAGANIPLANFRTGGDLVIYRKYGMDKGKTVSSGEKVIGNYDLPDEMVEGVESHTIKYGIGDLVIAPNRFIHEVTKGDEPEENRLLFSVHIAWMGDGSLALFS